MNARRSSRFPLFILLAVIILLLSACQPAALATSPQPTQPPAQPTAAPVILVTQVPAQPTQPPSGALPEITLDYSAVAQNVTIDTVPAVSKNENAFWTGVMPQYTLLTLQDYPVANHGDKPQIFIYPAGDLAEANENAGKAAADLQALLQTRRAGDPLPFLPLINAKQDMHPQVQYLDFKSGKGVRFLTQFNQGPVPINNFDLIYTFQGLTSDGKYYIAAVLPVTYPGLPADSLVNQQPPDDFRGYLSGIVALLDQQPASSFTPDLAKLDALVQSIEVK